MRLMRIVKLSVVQLGENTMAHVKSAIAAGLSLLAFTVLVATQPIGAQPTPQGQGPSMIGPSSSGQGPPRMPGGMMGDSAGTGVVGGLMSMMGAQYVEGQIAFLKTELKITDVQMPQWNAFADALRANARRMSEVGNTMMQGGTAGQSAPDRLNRMESMMTATIEAMKATKAALAPLYAVLTDEQKKTADQLIRGPMGMGHM
jgi:hypothetical protein